MKDEIKKFDNNISVDLFGTVNRNRKKTNKDQMLPIYELISNSINAKINIIR